MRSVRAVAVLSSVIVLPGVVPGVRGQAEKGPINLGLIVPETGPLAANGKDMVNALQLFLEQRQNKLAGRPVNLIVEDDAGVPATGLTKARSLIDGNRIHVLVGPLSAAVGYAVAPYVTEKKFPTLFPIVSSEDITQRKRSEYIVRTGWTSAQPSHPFGKYAHDALHFAKQYADAGLKGKLPLIGGGTFTDEHVLRTMGDESLGIVTSLHYSAALDTPANKKFVQAYEAKFNQVPSYYSEGTYVSCLALNAALEATGGNVEDREKLIAALRKIDLSSAPRGPIRIDEYGNPVENEYIRKVEKVNGRLQNTVIHTFPMVSQFWTYKPEEFLKNPVYGRDFPPCKNCGK